MMKDKAVPADGPDRSSGKKVYTVHQVRVREIQTIFSDQGRYYRVKAGNSEFLFWPVVQDEVAKVQVGDIVTIEFVRNGINKILVNIRDIRKPRRSSEDRFK